MKKIIYTLIAAFVACTAVAQTPSAYFMEGSTFRSQLNPAFAPLRGYVNIPVLGGVQVNVSGNLSVSDIFYPVNGSLVTLFDKNVSAAEALGNLRSKNMLGTDARINIVGFGAFRKDHKTFWSFDLNVRMEAEANMPYSLFDFLKNGTERGRYQRHQSLDAGLSRGRFQLLFSADGSDLPRCTG